MVVEGFTGFFRSQLNALVDLHVGGAPTLDGGPATLTIRDDGIVFGAATRIRSAGTVTLESGRFSVNTLQIDPGGTFDWQGGRFRIENLSIGSAQVLGSALTIDAARELEVVNQLTVEPSGTLNLDGGLIIAGAVDMSGIFNWTTGTFQITEDLAIETSNGFGADLAMSGSQSLLVDKALRVGAAGAGVVSVDGSAAVAAINTTVGGTAAGDGSITVSGGGTSLNTAVSLTVADAGTANVTIEDGAHLNSQFAAVGKQANADGTVTLQGGGSLWNVITNVSNQTTMPIGGAGKGTVNIGAGSMMVMDFTDAVLGEMTDGDGTVNVSGPNATWQFLNQPADTLTVGHDGTGLMNVNSGGTVISGKGFVACRSGSTGVVNVDGPDSSWHPLFLEVGGDGERGAWRHPWPSLPDRPQAERASRRLVA